MHSFRLRFNQFRYYGVSTCKTRCIYSIDGWPGIGKRSFITKLVLLNIVEFFLLFSNEKRPIKPNVFWFFIYSGLRFYIILTSYYPVNIYIPKQMSEWCNQSIRFHLTTTVKDRLHSQILLPFYAQFSPFGGCEREDK